MTDFEQEVINTMRNNGYAISIWYPSELSSVGLDQDEMEEHLTRTGNELIEYHRLDTEG